MRANTLRILGVDPGSRKAGWGVVSVDRTTRRIVHVDNGVIVLDEKAELPIRLLRLSQALRKVVEEHKPERAAVEDVFVRNSARSALILGQARGAAVATLGLLGLEVVSHTAPEVKARVTGRGRATKLQVAEMVCSLLALGEHPFEDAADALAVAFCQALEQLGPEVNLPSGGPGVLTKTARPRRRGRDALADLARAQGKL